MFSLSCWDLQNHNIAHHAFGIVGKPSMRKGAPRWFHNVYAYGERVIED
jgi:hypothetical protein